MPRIDLPKNTWVEEARIDYAQGGFWNGTLMVTLTMSGGPCPDTAFLATTLAKIAEQKLPKRRIVRITGLLNPTDQDLGKLVKILHDYGYSTQVVLSSIPDLVWLPYVEWIIYRVIGPVVPISFNELWYEPPEVLEIPEPVLPQPRVSAAGVPGPQFLYLKRAGSVSTVTKFICDSPRNWQLL